MNSRQEVCMGYSQDVQVINLPTARIGHAGTTALQVGDFLTIEKPAEGEELVMVTKSWVKNVEDELFFLQGLTTNMSRDLANLREQIK